MIKRNFVKTFGVFMILIISLSSSAFGTEPVWITPEDKVCTDNGGKIDEGLCYTRWEEAKKVCSISGGKLPSLVQLKKVITDCGGIINERDKNQQNTDYDKCYKESNFTMYAYWSDDEKTRGTAWYVGFFYGAVYSYNKRHFNYVRCVKTP